MTVICPRFQNRNKEEMGDKPRWVKTDRWEVPRVGEPVVEGQGRYGPYRRPYPGGEPFHMRSSKIEGDVRG